MRLPPPTAGEVRVAIEAVGVAYADIMMRQGVYAGHKPPITPGYDLVGRIEAIGPDVKDLAIGQRVAGITISGSYASRSTTRGTTSPQIVSTSLLNLQFLRGGSDSDWRKAGSGQCLGAIASHY